MTEPAVARYLADCPPEVRAALDALREIVRDAAPALVEEIKWNAPSFRLGDTHVVTLGQERKGGVRLVLHRGSAKREPDGFAFADPHALAAWPTADRGVVTFADAEAVRARAIELRDLVARWVAAVAPE